MNSSRPSNSLLEGECSLDISPCLSRQDVLAGRLEGLWHWGRGTRYEEAHGVGQEKLGLRLHLTRVLVLEGLTVDLGKLLGGRGWVGPKDERRLLSQEGAKELILSGGLLNIVSDGQESEPVGHELRAVVRVALDQSILVLDHLANAGDGVVTSVMVHGDLLFLGLDLRRDRVIDRALKRLQAQVRVGLEGLTRVLGHDTDAVG